MSTVFSFKEFSSDQYILEGIGSSKKLNPTFWSESSGSWKLDPRVRRKLLRIAEDFFESHSEVLKQRDIIDIQLSGAITNYNYTPHSDLDVYVITNLDGLDGTDDLKSELDKIRFSWNLNHNFSIRGHDVEVYLNSKSDEHKHSGLFSLLNDKWIVNPDSNATEIDEMDIQKKFGSLVYEIDQIENRLLLNQSLPQRYNDLYERSQKIKGKIHRMSRDKSINSHKPNNPHIGESVFNKLKKEGYIEKLIKSISKSYNRIHKIKDKV